MIPLKRTMEILDKAKEKVVLALGDLMLDATYNSVTNRLCPEASALVADVEEEQFFPGGVGNAAACMSTIGLETHLLAIIGGWGRMNYNPILLEECHLRNIICHFKEDLSRKTTLKLRIKGAREEGTQQLLLRVDCETRSVLSPETEREVIGSLKRLTAELRPAAISISDYKKGFLTKKIFAVAANISARERIPLFADLKTDTFVKFYKLIEEPALFHLKPNREESIAVAKIFKDFNKSGLPDEDIIEVGKIIQSKVPVNVVITRGKKGAVSFGSEGNYYFVHLRPEEIEALFDVTGAGDTVQAFLVASYIGGANMMEALEIAVTASQVAIRKSGTSVVTLDELAHWTSYGKILK